MKDMQYPQPASTPWRSDSAGSVTIKSAAEQDAMRLAGRLAAEVLDMIGPHVVAGASTEELDRICHEYIVDVQKAVPAPLGYRGYPKSICTSVNHVVCHGIPGDRRLKQGDAVNIDVTVIKDGFHGDTSRMYFARKPSQRIQAISMTGTVGVRYFAVASEIAKTKPAETARRIPPRGRSSGAPTWIGGCGWRVGTGTALPVRKRSGSIAARVIRG